MVVFKRIRPFICPVILLALLFISVLVFANVLIQRPTVQKYLLNKVSNAIGYKILTGDIELNFWGGIGILINDFESTSREGIKTFTASEVLVDLAISELIRGHLVADSLYLFRPEIQVTLKTSPDLAGSRNLLGVNDFKSIPLPNVQSIVIEQGNVYLIGHACNLNELNIKADRTSPAPLTFTVNAHGRMEFRGKEAPFDLRGIILPGFEKGESPFIDILLKLENTPLTWVPWPHSLPVKEGDCDAGLKITGNPGSGISISGKIDLESLKFSIKWRDRIKDFSIPEMSFDFQSLIKERSIRFDSLRMHNHDFTIDINMLVDLKEKESPYLELSAKSEFMPLKTLKMLFPSPILPVWLEKDLFPILSKGDVKLKTFNLAGDTKTIMRLKLPENRSALGMDFECKDFEVSGNGIQLPFNNVSADVSYKEGDFYVSGLKAYFGDSIINNAGLNVIRISGRPPLFRILMEGAFNLRELIGQRGMEVIPSKARLWVDQFKDIEGRMECKTEIGYEKGTGSPRILKGEFSFAECSYRSKETLFPLGIDKAAILINEANDNSLSGTGMWGNTAFNITATFGINEKDFDFRSVNIFADMDVNQMISSIPEGEKTPFSIIGNAPLSASMEKEKDRYSWRGSIGLENLALETEDFFIRPGSRGGAISFDLETFSEERIDLKEVLFQLKNSSIGLSGVYDLGKRHLYQLNADFSGLLLDDLGISIKKTGVPVSGILEGSLKISFADKSIRSGILDGTLQGSAVSFHSDMFKSPIRDCSFDLDFSGEGAIINDWDMKTGESMMNISGILKRKGDTLEGDILIRSDLLNMADVLSFENMFKPGEKDNFINDLQIGINLDISEGMWRKIRYGSVDAELALEKEGLYIKKSSMNLENGKLRISGHILGGDKPALLLSGDIKLAEQPVLELLESLKINKNWMIADLSLDARFSMEGKERTDLLPSLSGSGKMSIKEGLVNNSRVFIKVLNFLSLQNIYKERSEELKGDGFYFESMNADFVIDKGIIKSENFEMKSPAFNALAYGTADINEKSVDFILGSQPHGTIDSLISNIPIVGYIITGEKKSLMIYPFEVKGPMIKPEVTFIPLESLGEGVGGILTRLFLTPVRLLNGMSKTNDKQQEKEISPDNQ